MHFFPPPLLCDISFPSHTVSQSRVGPFVPTAVLSGKEPRAIVISTTKVSGCQKDASTRVVSQKGWWSPAARIAAAAAAAAASPAAFSELHYLTEPQTHNVVIPTIARPESRCCIWRLDLSRRHVEFVLLLEAAPLPAAVCALLWTALGFHSARSFIAHRDVDPMSSVSTPTSIRKHDTAG